MKPIPNIITALRILGAACLLFCNPAGAPFWVIYGLCGISDMADGYLARKLQAESKTGAVLDSVADICFVACCAIRLIPFVQIPTWLWIWAGVIVAVKIVNQVSALIVCKRFCFPHTTANKLTGLLLFLTVPTVFWSIVQLLSLPVSPHSHPCRKGISSGPDGLPLAALTAQRPCKGVFLSRRHRNCPFCAKTLPP